MGDAIEQIPTSPLILASVPDGLPLPAPRIADDGTFGATVRVPAGTAPDAYTITASCTSIAGATVLARTGLIVTTAPPVTPTGSPDPTDPPGSTDGPGPTGTTEPPETGTPAVVVPGYPPTTAGPSRTAPLAVTALLVAAAALVVARAVRRRPAGPHGAAGVSVRAVPGPVVGPSIGIATPGGVRVVPRGDPGHRTLHIGSERS